VEGAIGGYLFQSQRFSQIGPLPDQFDGSPIVEAEELLEHQEGEQLGLGVLVRALGMRVRRQRLPACLKGHGGHGSRVFAGVCHIPHIGITVSFEQSKALHLSKNVETTG